MFSAHAPRAEDWVGVVARARMPRVMPPGQVSVPCPRVCDDRHLREKVVASDVRACPVPHCPSAEEQAFFSSALCKATGETIPSYEGATPATTKEVLEIS